MCYESHDASIQGCLLEAAMMSEASSMPKRHKIGGEFRENRMKALEEYLKNVG